MSSLEKAVRFFCAAAPGIALGLWLAKMFGFWWPMGATVGAGVSYLLIEWKTAVKAFPKAFEKAWSCVANKNLWADTGLVALVALSGLLTVVTYFFGTFYFISFASGASLAEVFKKGDNVFSGTFFGLLGSIFFTLSMIAVAFGIIFVCMCIVSVIRDLINRPYSREVIHGEYWHVIKFANPLAVFLYWPARGLWNLPHWVKWLCENVLKDVLLFLVRFARGFLLIVHNQKRSLCAMTTLITVTIGYLADGNILVFTIAGATIGALYSISPLKEWMVVRLQPVTT